MNSKIKVLTLLLAIGVLLFSQPSQAFVPENDTIKVTTFSDVAAESSVDIGTFVNITIVIKNLTNEKNSSAVFYKLGKRADNIERYINDYLFDEGWGNYELYDKASKDLGINFSLYERHNLIYSTEGTFYTIGLFPKIETQRL